MTDLLDLLDAVAENPQPVAQQYRDRIRAAIIADGRNHGGEVNPNRVRAALSNLAAQTTSGDAVPCPKVLTLP